MLEYDTHACRALMASAWRRPHRHSPQRARVAKAVGCSATATVSAAAGSNRQSASAASSRRRVRFRRLLVYGSGIRSCSHHLSRVLPVDWFNLHIT